MEINGFAHLNLTVSDFEKSLPFYKKLFALLELKELIVGDGYYYCVGRRVGFGIQACAPENQGVPADQGRAGLHHFCLSMKSREDVDTLAHFVREEGLTLIREPAPNDDWFPGMYSLLFEDRDGIRIEANHIQRSAH